MEQKLRRDRCIGDNLRTLRCKYNISQEKLCAELQRRGCDIGRSSYAKYEAGELNVRISILIELKKIYGCTFDDFFEGLDISDSKNILIMRLFNISKSFARLPKAEKLRGPLCLPPEMEDCNMKISSLLHNGTNKKDTPKEYRRFAAKT